MPNPHPLTHTLRRERTTRPLEAPLSARACPAPRIPLVLLAQVYVNPAHRTHSVPRVLVCAVLWVAGAPLGLVAAPYAQQGLILPPRAPTLRHPVHPVMLVRTTPALEAA